MIPCVSTMSRVAVARRCPAAGSGRSVPGSGDGRTGGSFAVLQREQVARPVPVRGRVCGM